MNLSAVLNQTLVPLELDTGRDDLGSASVKEIEYRKPSGDEDVWTATADGTTLRYQFVDGDLDELGYWKVRVHIVIGGKHGYGSWQTLEVIS